MRFSGTEEFLDFTQDLYEPINLFEGVIEIKARASGGFNSELPHQRLITVVPSAKSDTALVRDSHQVMRMNIFQ